MFEVQDPSAELAYRRERLTESIRTTRATEKPHRRFRHLARRHFHGRG